MALARANKYIFLDSMNHFRFESVFCVKIIASYISPSLFRLFLIL